jgi:hypothetical protein
MEEVFKIASANDFGKGSDRDRRAMIDHSAAVGNGVNTELGKIFDYFTQLFSSLWTGCAKRR